MTRLQELLKTDPEIYPDGLVTGYYGSLTRVAVRKFQQKYGLSVVGRVGPQTRAKLQEVFGGVTTPSLPSPVSPAASSVALQLTRGLDIGSSGGDVRALQEYLVKNPEIYPNGLVTGYYGRLTQAAVERFQEKYNLAVPGDPGYGYTGPKTRAKILELTSQ